MKNKLRKELIEIRRNIPKYKILEKSNKIKNRLFKMDEFKHASTILFYISYGNEVYTHDMIKFAMSNRKNVIVPVSDKNNRRLILSEFNNWDDLETGAYDILEPKKYRVTSIDKVDLVIIPGIGFDEKGYRIGHGKGYYDKLLSNSKNALHIGLAFEFQIIKKVPTEYHDIPVHKIVTEKRVIDCRKQELIN